MIFDEMIALLPKLNATQLRELNQRVAAMRGLSRAGTNDGSDVDLVCETIVQAMSSCGFPCSLQQLRNDGARYRAFVAKVPELFQYVRTATVVRNEQRALLRMGFKFVIEDLHWMKVPLSGTVLMNNILTIPASLDKRFPGYARLGLLSHVVRQIGGENVRQERSGGTDVRPRRSVARA